MSCLLSKYQLLSRRQYRIATGIPISRSAPGGYPYVISATVPQQRYWLVWFASIIAGDTPQQQVCPGSVQLNVIPNGTNVPTLPAGTSPDDPFFLAY